MAWYSFFDAVLFDLDGLLVNTEALHWQAYKDMCQQNGYDLDWDFETYYSIASRSALGVQNRLHNEMPEVFQKKTWHEMYQEKKAALRKRLQIEAAPLMPGVFSVLQSLQHAAIPIAVVTHSPKDFVDHVKQQHAVFSVIQYWFTREEYINPKPAPDGYIRACQFFDVKPHRVVGFEDSLRGIASLTSAGCRPVFVQKHDMSARKYCCDKGVLTLNQIDEILELDI